MLYVEIHQMYKRNFTVSQIAKQLKISRTTVYKYLDMTFEEVQEWFGMGLEKTKKLDEYLDWILAWLEEFPHLSAAQANSFQQAETSGNQVESRLHLIRSSHLRYA